MPNKSLQIEAGDIFISEGFVNDSIMVHYFRDNGGSGSPTNLSIYGSLNGINFKLIKTYSAETIEKYSIWYPFIAVTTGTSAIRVNTDFDETDNFGDSEIHIYEDL